MNTLTNQRTLLANYALLPPWTTMQLQHLIAAGTYSVTLIIVHTHEYVFMDTLQRIQKAPEYIYTRRSTVNALLSHIVV